MRYMYVVIITLILSYTYIFVAFVPIIGGEYLAYIYL